MFTNTMTTDDRRRGAKSILLAAALVAAAGLSAPALAGHEKEAKAGSRTTTRTNDVSENSQTTVWCDGKREVKIERKGDSASICIDGRQIGSFNCAKGHDEHFKAHDHISKVKAERNGDTLTVTDEDGEVLVTLDLQGAVWSDAQWDQDWNQFKHFEHLQNMPNWVWAADPGQMPKVMIGVTMDGLGEDDAPEGVDAEKATRIITVFKGLPASRAGVEDGDIIIAFNGEDDASPEGIRKVLREKKPGDEVRVRVIRGGKRENLVLKLDAYDAEQLGQRGRAGPLMRPHAQAELQAKLEALSAELEKMGAELGAATSDRAREKIGREMGRIGAEMGRIGAEMGRLQAESLLRQDFGAQPRVEIRPRRPGEPPEAIVVRPEAGRRVAEERARARDEDRRLESIEERLARLEKLLERLAEQQEKGSR